jgi:ribosome biogenesis GTPase
VIVLSKSDLCRDPGGRIADVEAVACGADIHAISALTGAGIEELDRHLVPGRTIALVGSSGAGKSTLVNRLFGVEIRRTLEIRSSDERGKHATSTRDIILLPGGAIMLDTPGMRELQLWDADASVRHVFHEVESLAAACRFGDCSHQTEPGCAVREALESGAIDRRRIESFEKLRKEAEFFELKQKYGAKRAETKRWKKAMEMMKKRENRR